MLEPVGSAAGAEVGPDLEAFNPAHLFQTTVIGYSPVVRVGDLLFVSGQVGRARDGTVVGAGDAAAQARQAYRNLRDTLEAAGSGIDRVAKLNIFATSREDKPAIDAARREVFEPLGYFPAATFVVVSGLARPELLVEIEAVAAAGGGR